MVTPNIPLDSNRLMEVIRVQTDIAKLGLDLGGIMDLVTQRARELTGGDGAVIELLDGDDMVYRAVAGIAEPQLGLRLNVNASLSGHCVKTAKAICCMDSELDEHVDKAACRKVGLRSMVLVPLMYNDSATGVLKVMAKQPNAFNDADKQILDLLSELIGATMFHSIKYGDSELLHQATHDSLTGLANRSLFFDRIRQLVTQSTRNNEKFGVLYIDMDDLKKINDQQGHRAGDVAIKALAARMLDASREADTIARLGGDEFGVILSRINNQADIDLIIRRYVKKISAPFELNGRLIPMKASLGFSIFPDDGTDADMLLEKADKSMYLNKRERKRGEL